MMERVGVIKPQRVGICASSCKRLCSSNVTAELWEGSEFTPPVKYDNATAERASLTSSWVFALQV